MQVAPSDGTIHRCSEVRDNRLIEQVKGIDYQLLEFLGPDIPEFVDNVRSLTSFCYLLFRRIADCIIARYTWRLAIITVFTRLPIGLLHNDDFIMVVTFCIYNYCLFR